MVVRRGQKLGRPNTRRVEQTFVAGKGIINDVISYIQVIISGTDDDDGGSGDLVINCP